MATTLLSQLLAYQRYLFLKEAQDQLVLEEANRFKERFNGVLENSRSAIKTLAFVITKYGVDENFDSIAEAILQSNPYIDALEITNQGTITHVYPLAGHETVIGFNVLSDSIRKVEALKAIEKREMFFAGPFELRQGGLAILGRLPVFRDDKFQGFSVALIRFPTMLKAIGVDGNSGFIYQLSKKDPISGETQFFLPVPDGTDVKDFVAIDVPEGEWRLYVGRQSTDLFPGVILFSLLGIVLSATAGIFTWNLAWQPEKLNRLVRIKTSEIIRQKQNTITTLERVSDAFVALDKNWCFTYINKKAGEIFNCDPEAIIGKNIWEEFPETKDTPFHQAYHKAMREQHFVSLEAYYEPLDGWFENHIYPSPDGISVYFRDITEKVRAARIAEYEKQMSDSIINSLPGVFYLFDRHGKYLRWNKNFEVVSGYSAEEISRADALLFIYREERNRVRESIEEVFATGKGEITANVATRERKVIPYHFNGMKVTFDNEEYIIGMGIDISERIAAESALLERNEEIQKLTTHLQNIREEERTHMAREIHDVLGQQLTALKMDASWLKKNVVDDRALERLAAMVGLIDETIRTVRKISSELRPGVLDDLGLIAALEWQTTEFEKNTGIRSTFHSEQSELPLDQKLATHVFRIYQEALTNVARHANATLVSSYLRVSDQVLTLEVRDNGKGFDPEEVRLKKRLGLVGMRERAKLYGGDVVIRKNDPTGSVVTLEAPLHTSIPLML